MNGCAGAAGESVLRYQVPSCLPTRSLANLAFPSFLNFWSSVLVAGCAEVHLDYSLAHQEVSCPPDGHVQEWSWICLHFCPSIGARLYQRASAWPLSF